MNFRIFASLMILSLIFTSGCLDLEFIYHTKINKDGSIMRKVQATGDSTDVYENPFPFYLDSLWSLTYSQTVRDTDSVYMIEVNRTFADVDELNGIYEFLRDSSETETISVRLEKSFQWFYNYYSWVEYLPQQFPFSKVPIDSFITKDEMNYWLYSDTTILEKQSNINEDELEKTIDSKLDVYISKAIFEDFIEILIPFAKGKGIGATLIQKKDQLSQKLIRPVLDHDIDSLYFETDRFLGYPLCEEAKSEGLFETFAYKFEHMLDQIYLDESFTYFLDCPGDIVGGNATIDSNDIASWKFEGNNFFFKDYEMKLEYRIPNYWAFAVTVFVLLFLLWFIVRSGKRERI